MVCVCVCVGVLLSRPLRVTSLFSLSPPIVAMHLFGLNWQMQETEGYTFENGQGKSDTTPNTITALSADNGKEARTHKHRPTHWALCA